MYVEWDILSKWIAEDKGVRFMKLDVRFFITRNWFEKNLFAKHDKTSIISFIARQDSFFECVESDRKLFNEIEKWFGIASSSSFYRELDIEWLKFLEKEKDNFYKSLDWKEL